MEACPPLVSLSAEIKYRKSIAIIECRYPTESRKYPHEKYQIIRLTGEENRQKCK